MVVNEVFISSLAEPNVSAGTHRFAKVTAAALAGALLAGPFAPSRSFADEPAPSPSVAAPTPNSASAPLPPEAGTHPKFDRADPIPQQLQDVGVKEMLDQPLPLDLPFVDETGKTVRLREFFSGKKPVVINLGYYGCPMLCGLVTKGLVGAVGTMDWTPGQEYEIVTVSIDPHELPALAQAKKRSIIEAVGRPQVAKGWHFLTGDEKSIKMLTDSVGFRFRWDEGTKQFAHTAVLVLATPDGRVSRYLYGIQFPQKTVRLSLVEASEGKVGSVMDQLLLFCYHFDPAAGSYSLQAMALMRIAGLLTMISLATFIGVALTRESRRARQDALLTPAPGTNPGTAASDSGQHGTPGGTV